MRHDYDYLPDDSGYRLFISTDAKEMLRRERRARFFEFCTTWAITCAFGVLLGWAAVDQFAR